MAVAKVIAGESEYHLAKYLQEDKHERDRDGHELAEAFSEPTNYQLSQVKNEPRSRFHISRIPTHHQPYAAAPGARKATKSFDSLPSLSGRRVDRAEPTTALLLPRDALGKLELGEPRTHPGLRRPGDGRDRAGAHAGTRVARHRAPTKKERRARALRGEFIGGTLGGPTATPLQIMAEAAPFRRARPDIKSPVVHISISLQAEDGRKSPEQWAAMVKRFLELMDFPTHGAWACYRHQDTSKDHVHLMLLRSLGDGSIWDDKWSAKRAIAATERLEIEFGLHRHSREKNTDQKTPRNEEILAERMAQKGKKLDKQHIREALDSAVEGLGKTYTLAQLRDALAARGVTVDAYTPASAKGQIKGLKFGHEGFHVQAGQLGEGYTAAALFGRGLAKFVDGSPQSVDQERPGQSAHSGPAPTPAPRVTVTPEQAAQARQALDRARGGVKEQFDQAHQAGIAEHLIRMAMALALLLAKLIEALFGLKPGALGSWEYHPSTGARAVPPSADTLKGVDVAALAQAQARLAVQLNKLTDALKTGDMDKLPSMPDARFAALREQLAAANREEAGFDGAEGAGDDEREEPSQRQRREGDHV